MGAIAADRLGTVAITRLMAREVGIPPASVQRIWQQHGLQPHRVKTFKPSKNPAFASKLRDVVDL